MRSCSFPSGVFLRARRLPGRIATLNFVVLVHAGMNLHPVGAAFREALLPLVSLLGLMHRQIPLSCFVLSPPAHFALGLLPGGRLFAVRSAEPFAVHQSSPGLRSQDDSRLDRPGFPESPWHCTPTPHTGDASTATLCAESPRRGSAAADTLAAASAQGTGAPAGGASSRPSQPGAHRRGC